MEATTIIKKSWQNLKASTIQNCFAKCGIKNTTIHQQEIGVQIGNNDNDDVRIQPEVWDAVNEVLNNENPTTFDEFIDIDSNIAVTGIFTDFEIAENVISQKEENKDDEPGDEIDEFIEEDVSAADAKIALKKLKISFERCESVNERTFSNLIDIENDFDTRVRNNMKQLTIKDFFKK